MQSTRYKIGITIGCPCGIGPEIVEKAVQDPRVLEVCTPRVFQGSDPFAGTSDKLASLSALARGGLTPAECGLVSFSAVESAAKAALNREVDAIVTAPINKSHWRAAGINFPGHTEYLAHVSGVKAVAMMMVSPRLRVSLVTTHVPLAKVPQLITKERVCGVVRLTHGFLCGTVANFSGVRRKEPDARIGVGSWESGRPNPNSLFPYGHQAPSSQLPAPKIAVCGLNPHAGEGELLGNEEETTIIPAINELKKEGIDVSGPYPADSVFYRAAEGEFDAVVAMYHDQGLAPIKSLDFPKVVNVTLGLPFVRTSVGHGTAELAKGHADHSNLVEAIRVAVSLAEANDRI